MNPGGRGARSQYLRETLASHQALARKLEALVMRVEGHGEAFRSVIAAIRQLMKPPPPR